MGDVQETPVSVDELNDARFLTWCIIRDSFASLLCGVIVFLLYPRFKLDSVETFATAVLTLAGVAITISVFVCTMNYTTRNSAIDLMRRRLGYAFKKRWKVIFTLEIVGAIVPLVALLISQRFTQVSLTLCAIAATLLIAQMRRVLILLSMVIDSEEQAKEKNERDKVLKDKRAEDTEYAKKALRERREAV